MSQIVRIVEGRAGTISATLTVDGVPTDPVPPTATIQIMRADGTVLIPTAAAQKPPGTTGKFTFTLAPDKTSPRPVGRLLTARWAATLVGYPQTLTTMVEIVGPAQVGARDHLAEMTAADASPKLSDDDLYDLLARHVPGDSWALSEVTPENFDAAAAEGWRWKAARATTATAQNLDGTLSFDRPKYEAMVRQAEYYESRMVGGQADNRASFASIGMGGRSLPAEPDVTELP